MDAPDRQRWFPGVLLLGAAYFVIAVALGEFAGRAASGSMREIWNRLAFVACGIAFALHIGYEHFRLRNSSLVTAMHVSIAVALGAFALAVKANIHDLGSSTGYRSRMLIALAAWPLLTGVPAFVVALVVAAGLALRRRST